MVLVTLLVKTKNTVLKFPLEGAVSWLILYKMNKNKDRIILFFPFHIINEIWTNMIQYDRMHRMTVERQSNKMTCETCCFRKKLQQFNVPQKMIHIRCNRWHSMSFDCVLFGFFSWNPSIDSIFFHFNLALKWHWTRAERIWARKWMSQYGTRS